MTDEEMAEEYATEKCKECFMCSTVIKNGYKGHCEYFNMRKDGFLAGLKAQWHYVKDGNPEELHDVLCFTIHNEHRFVLQGYIRDGRWVLSPLGTYLNNDDVIAWKEIVLPKESK